MRRNLLMLTAALLTLGLGCSLPTDDKAAIVDPEDLPDVLRSDLEVEIEEADTPGPLTITATIFLLEVVGERNVVVERDREVSPQAGFTDRIELLFGEEVRSEEEQELYSNALREFTLLGAEINDNDVAIINMVALDENGVPIPTEAEVLRNAAAQLVYTATGFPDVVAVRIRIDGERISLPTSEGDTEEIVDRDDYVQYDPSFEVPTSTTPSSTTQPPDQDD
ncbi:MAG: GerMN domain-containing protein [Acidimicrobiales bacterium]|nr:GerMN domain-containing protein [Acidimicrobiales bacterium]